MIRSAEGAGETGVPGELYWSQILGVANAVADSNWTVPGNKESVILNYSSCEQVEEKRILG